MNEVLGLKGNLYFLKNMEVKIIVNRLVPVDDKNRISPED